MTQRGNFKVCLLLVVISFEIVGGWVCLLNNDSQLFFRLKLTFRVPSKKFHITFDSLGSEPLLKGKAQYN
jgi:hypothetical protein